MAAAKVVRVEDVLEGPQDVNRTSPMQMLVSGGEGDGERKSTAESSLRGQCHIFTLDQGLPTWTLSFKCVWQKFGGPKLQGKCSETTAPLGNLHDLVTILSDSILHLTGYKFAQRPCT